MGEIAKTLLKCAAGFVVGWVIYMVAMVLTVYDGGLSLIFQPIMAGIFSGVFVVGALLVGLPLRAPKIREVWSHAGLWPLLLTFGAIGVMIFHAQLGLQAELVDPETKEKVKTMLPVAALICYFVAIFPIVNLPSKRGPIQSTTDNAGAAPRRA
jgi:succinate dehydrogenase hydrophobic anchor subunit